MQTNTNSYEYSTLSCAVRQPLFSVILFLFVYLTVYLSILIMIAIII